MLKKLYIKNYALIQNLHINPSSGLNIVTGETGAGKSIMLGAVGLLLGKRADTKVLFNQDQKCVIEGEFNVKDYRMHSLFEKKELDYSDDSIFRREINPSGKSRAFINDTPVTLDIMKEIGEKLLDIHSQNDTLLLGSNAFQLSIIDIFAHNANLLQDYQAAYQNYKIAKRKYKQIKEEAQNLRDEWDYNNFLLDELKKVNLQKNEQEVLEKELKMMEHAEEIKVNLNNISALISQSDYNVIQNLQEVVRLISSLTGYAEKYQDLKNRLESSLIELNDINNEIEKAESEIDYDPGKIEEFKNRLSEIYRLQQKHHVSSIEELLEIKNNLEEKADRFSNLDDDLERASAKVQETEKATQNKAKLLSQTRKKCFDPLKNNIEDLLKELGIPDGVLEIQREEIEPGSDGIDAIRFLFSANKGVKPKELKDVASGGEFSRLMFCIKYILADKTALPTIIFDEIDNGVSGEIALKLGKMMSIMAGNHQVISISHLPQIAAKGRTHYFVFKDSSGGVAESKVKLLSENERIEEIAKMIGGENPTENAFDSARELMLEKT